MASTILAVGAAGKFAGSVIPAVRKRGGQVRGMVRKIDQMELVLRRGAAEVVVADLTDRKAVASALIGVDAVFYIAPAFFPDEAQIGVDMVDAARRAGVRRFVFSSVIHPVLSALPNHAAKAPVEEAVLDSGMEYTFLHPAVYFQNYALAWNRITETGVLAEPWSAETRFSRVDYRDVADVAAIALVEDRLVNGTFELCAEGHLNRKEVASLLTDVLGREVIEQRLDAAELGDAAARMKPMLEHYEHHGLLGNALTLRAILGREPRSLRDYFGELMRGVARFGDG